MFLRTIWLGLFLLAAGSGEQGIAHAQRTMPHRPIAAAVPEPCDIYASAGTPCVAAHSTTRALYAGYRGALYQVRRITDGRTLDIGVFAPRSGTEVTYANAGAQDQFCSNALCLINIIFDQSGRGNHLYQAAPGTFKGPSKGAFDALPIADMDPVLLGGHKVYGAYIMPGMGLRNNDASFLPIADEPQGIYYVIDGTHYDSGCCFDYGNASTNGRAVGTGTMDTTYFGTSTVWGKGAGEGPWIMTDMEAGLFSGHSAKENSADPTINSWRFVTAMVNGGGGNQWELRGGDAQKGMLTTFYSGVRPDPNPSGGYFPMRRQGGVLLGTGGDNGNGSSGTFYEGVITAGQPSQAATDAVQANIVAAQYSVARIALSRIKAFAPASSQGVTVTFTNPSGNALNDVELKLVPPTQQWSAISAKGTGPSVRLAEVAPGTSVTAAFTITSPKAPGSGFLNAIAEWKTREKNIATQEVVTQRVRTVPPVRINEVRFATASDVTDQFIELYNASDKAIDISNWSLIHTPSQWASIKLAAIPRGTIMPGRGFYVFGVAGSGLVVPTSPGDTTIHLRNVSGLSAGQSITVDGERHMIASVGTAASPFTTIFVPVSTGPRLTFPAGSVNLPIASDKGFAVGQKIGIDAGGHYDIATVTHVGKAATQTELAQAVHAGADHIHILTATDVVGGDTLIIGTGQRKETVKVAAVSVGNGKEESDIRLARPLRLGHMSGVDVSDRGTGISFSSATKFAHASGDAMQALGSGITLDRPLQRAHDYGTPVLGPQENRSGYRESTPNQWVGSAMSPSAGSITLVDATGASFVDAMVYGSRQSNSSGNGTIASPELAVLEGDQAGGGCIVVVPDAVGSPGTSVGRYPDGADTDSNCQDFHPTGAVSLSMNASAGSTNIKVTSVGPFAAGQSIVIGSGPSLEPATIATVGTAGAALLYAQSSAGATVLPVSSTSGFASGQTIFLGTGPESEVAVVASLVRRPSAVITITAPLARPHAAGSAIVGTGITLAAGLSRSHDSGEIVASEVPSPGKSNQYSAARNGDAGKTRP